MWKSDGRPENPIIESCQTRVFFFVVNQVVVYLYKKIRNGCLTEKFFEKSKNGSSMESATSPWRTFLAPFFLKV